MFAVIRTKGHQYVVEKGTKIVVDFFGQEKGDKVLFEEVLLSGEGENVKVGKPVLSDAKVEGKIVKHFKGDKIKVFKMKPKKRYQRTIGFRPLFTEIEILSIKT